MFRNRRQRKDITPNVDVLAALWPYLDDDIRGQILASHASIIEGGADVRPIPSASPVATPAEAPGITDLRKLPARRLA